MSRLVKFLILAVIGFGLGAGLAYFQQSQNAPQTSDIVASDTASSDIATAAPEMPAADNADAAATTDAAPVAGSTVGGAFTLVDFNGVEVTEKSWPGKLKLVFFGFTSCPDICPVALDKMTSALNTLASDKIQPLFITVDPARDTGEAMKTYLGNYHPTIIGLTGSDEQLKAAQDGYKVYATKQAAAEGHEGHYNVDHSGYIYLIGENEELLEIFGSDATAENIVEKTKARLEAAPAEAPAEEAPAAETTATETPAEAPAESSGDLVPMGADAPADTTAETPALDAVPPQPAADEVPALDVPADAPVDAPADTPAEESSVDAPASEEAPAADVPAEETAPETP